LWEPLASISRWNLNELSGRTILQTDASSNDD
jgi:hypothetical protein